MGDPILIAGAGAIGSVFGAMLRGAGHEVTMLGRRAHLDAIARHGLAVSGLLGSRSARGFILADDVARLSGRFALILCTVKSYDTAAVATGLSPRLADDGVVVSMQNGLGNIEALAESFGAARVLGARVIFGAELRSPGAAHVTVFAEPVAIGPAPAVNGEASAALEARAGTIAEMLTTAGIPTRACADIMPILWTKLLYNAALNPLGALLELHYGAIGDAPELRAIMDRVIDEAFAVARRLDVALPFADPAEYKALFYGRLIPSTYDHRPTMLGDLRRRGRTEIGALNGKIVEFADRLGLKADANRALLSLIRASERIRQLSKLAARDARATMTSEDNRAFRLSRAAMDAIVAQGEREFPYECCGFIIGNESIEEVRPVTNIQSRMHAADPATYRRGARTAFLMEPKEHLAVLREVDDRKLMLKAVYHSHPDHDAYFSATDRAQACSFDPNEPDYPATAYIVLSIKGGKFARAAAFVWDPARREFVETPLSVV